MTIGEKIKRIRCQMGLTQDELALAAKTTKQTIHKYETGIISNIPASKIKAIADKLCTTPAYLMGWEESLTVSEEPSFSLRKAALFGFDREPYNSLSEDKIKELKTLLDSACHLTIEQIKMLKQLADNLKKNN